MRASWRRFTTTPGVFLYREGRSTPQNLATSDTAVIMSVVSNPFTGALT